VAGVEAQHWVSGQAPLQYLIEFENQPSATLPAQRVVVTDKLDPTKFNLSQLTLSQMGFGETLLSPAGGSQSFNSIVDLRPAQDLEVNIQGSLDSNTGTLMWTFQSIDPSTGLPPDDPTVGFLPPDKTPPAGSGSVAFSVTPIAGLPAGAAISNQATVVFDQNAPIETPVWTNTIANETRQKIAISPNPAKFARQVVFGDSGATSKPVTVTVSDRGNGHSGSLLITGASTSGDFAVLNPDACDGPLGRGKTCKYHVVFAPTATGKRVGALRISDNNINGFQQISLFGTGIAGTLKFQPRALVFGKVQVGSTSIPAKTLTILNKSGAEAEIASVVASAGFVTSNDTCSGVILDADKSCTVDLAFQPETKGRINGHLTVTTDSSKSPQNVKLSGVGVPP
jgi:Abnormal spindle-like microcephaly-assoc'd, ASPM-SPD-2-Hydin